jgi:hypothetical protein
MAPERLSELLASPERARKFMGSEETEDGVGYDPDDWWPKGPLLDLDKSWHVIHYLLTNREGDADPPLGNAVLGGTVVVADFGQGSLRYLTPEQVNEVASALATVDESFLHSKWVPSNRTEIYGWPWHPPRDIPRHGLFGRFRAPMRVPDPSSAETEESWKFVLDRFHALQRFYEEASRGSDAVILWID